MGQVLASRYNERQSYNSYMGVVSLAKVTVWPTTAPCPDPLLIVPVTAPQVD